MNRIERWLVERQLKKEVKSLSKYKNLTHFIALVVGSVAAFLMTPAGEALVKQYPHLTDIAAIVVFLAGLYGVTPKKPVQGNSQ